VAVRGRSNRSNGNLLVALTTPPVPWNTRLKGLNHSKGTFSKMIQDCMLEEIKDLRKQNRSLIKRYDKAEDRIKIWKAHTLRYQKLLGALKRSGAPSDSGAKST